MICPKCNGFGFLKHVEAITPSYSEWSKLPCPECQGSGIVSCCDTAGASDPTSPYWQPGLEPDGTLRKIEPNDPLPGVWAGNSGASEPVFVSSAERRRFEHGKLGDIAPVRIDSHEWAAMDESERQRWLESVGCLNVWEAKMTGKLMVGGDR